MTASVESFDVLILGAGQAAKPLAMALAKAGRRVAVVERSHVGGTCINEGCTPTKTMVASARVAHLARRGADYGVMTGPIGIDLAVVRRRKRAIVESFRGGSERQLAGEPNIVLRYGTARFTGPKIVSVVPDPDRAGGDAGVPARRLTAPTVVINTGGRPARPDIPGFDTIDALDSTTIMELDAVPGHLVVLGAGYIGLEFAQMFRRFGSRVTVIGRGNRVLGREDADVAGALADILRAEGIDLRLDTAVTGVEWTPGGVRARVRLGGADDVIDGTHLLAAVGRVPNTDWLDPTAAGIAVDHRGFIPVDDHLETNVPGVFAVGDVNGGPTFTHIAYDDYRILASRLLDADTLAHGRRPASTAGRLLPYVVFTDPQLGRIGLTETAAREQGLAIRVARIPMTRVARALETDESAGFLKAIVDERTDRILGAAVLGIEGGEIMGALQVAMMGGVTAAELRDAVFAHPTLMECLNTLFA